MPTLISTEEIKLEWADLRARRPKRRPRNSEVRSSGVHLSGVIRYVLRTTGQMKTEDLTDSMPQNVAMGQWFEEGVVGLYPDLIWQPGEEVVDNVYMSPDGLSPDEGHGPVLEEFKYTLKSERSHTPVTNEKLWMYQLAGYVKALQYLNVRRARLHVWWAAGSYRPPTPKYMRYTLDFTPVEVDRFWTNVILTNKEHAVAEEH